MRPEEREFTEKWWSALLQDETRLNQWLRKLQRTEAEGLHDNLEAAQKYAAEGGAAFNIFMVTGMDEERHGQMLGEILLARGLEVADEAIPESVYWSTMHEHITDLRSCAAVFHLGEQMAADRFNILLHHPDTPADIWYFLRAATPDEEYHTRTFGRLAGEEAVEAAKGLHQLVTEKMRRG